MSRSVWCLIPINMAIKFSGKMDVINDNDKQ